MRRTFTGSHLNDVVRLDNHYPYTITNVHHGERVLSLNLCPNYPFVTDIRRIYISESRSCDQLKKQVIDELRIRNKSPCDVFLSFLDDNGTWNGINDAYSKLSLFASNIHDNDYIAAHFRYVQQPLSIDSQAVLSFRLCRNTRLKHSFIDMYIRATVTLSYLKAIAIDKLNIYTKPNETVTLLLNKDNNDLWIAFDSKVEDCTLEELEFRNNSYICVDIKSITYLPGVRGLRNTGNTCFMNSALQCLSNVPQLTEYFLTSTDISHTRIACVYSELIKALWSEGSLSLALDTFTLVIQADLPRFDNYKQHDAQEFMNYLINILHTELASQSTIITDLFYGKIRSTVHCLTCKSNESTTEVVSFLPLPLTNRKKKQRLFEINHVKLNGDRQSCIIETDSNGTVSTLLHSFIDYCINENQDDNDIPDLESLIVAKMNGNDVKSQYSLDESLKSVVDNQISVFEVPLMISKHDRMYTPCLFLDNDSHCYFRPPIYLVTPKSNCYGQDVAYQIQKIIKHIVSVTGERPTDVFWTSYSSNYQRHLVSSMNENLYSLKSIIIETSHLCAKAYTSKSKQSSASNTSISQELTLSNLMDDFLKEADLDGQYYCSKCKLQTAAKQKSELCSPLPPIIIIQLKRFTYDIYSSDKIDTFIDYPVNNFDLGQYEKDAIYDLISVINHMGTLSSGHYLTYSKNHRTQKWYSFNDEVIREIKDNDEGQLITKNAYVLVYMRQKPQLEEQLISFT